MNTFHKPVLLHAVINYLNIADNKKYIDATLGGAGHTIEILKKGGIVLGIDQDQEALDFVKANLPIEYRQQAVLVKDNFKNIKEIARQNNFSKVSGILFDLGVSSYQLEKVERGFSFKKEALLDMRMDKSLTTSARDVINSESLESITRIFMKFGEEPLAKAIALSIIKKRKKRKIMTTTELAEIVTDVYKSFKKIGDVHPATKVFQALRITVNNELEVLKKSLSEAVTLLEKGGRLLVISYHSLEDRVVKLTMQNEKLRIITKKPIRPSYEEVRMNHRARSAKLRVVEKL